MSLETYTLIVAILSAISFIWWVLSNVFHIFEKRYNDSLRQIIQEQDKEIKRLKDENSEYYARFGIIKKDGQK
jgi:C4-dicarboxylate transporter